MSLKFSLVSTGKHTYSSCAIRIYPAFLCEAAAGLGGQLPEILVVPNLEFTIFQSVIKRFVDPKLLSKETISLSFQATHGRQSTKDFKVETATITFALVDDRHNESDISGRVHFCDSLVDTVKEKYLGLDSLDYLEIGGIVGTRELSGNGLGRPKHGVEPDTIVVPHLRPRRPPR